MQELEIFLEIEKRKALKELVFDSIDVRLYPLIARVDLRGINNKEVCVIVFSHPLALKEWERVELKTLEKMRELYRQRNLKRFLRFSKVLVEVGYLKKEEKEQEREKRYTEQSSGEFEIQAKDEDIKACFKAIQVAIKANLAKEL